MEATGDGRERQDGAGWESFSIEGTAWQDDTRGPFTLDEEEEELLAPSAGAAGGARPAGSGRQQLHKTISRLTLQGEEECDSWKTYGHEAHRIAELALPLTISQFFSFALSLIAVAFVGRLGEDEMAISVLATSFMNVTGFSLVLGLLGALDTLCGQAWGARNYRALGVTLQKAVVTTLAISAAVCLLWAHVEWLMLAVGQQPRIAAGAARFLLLATPALMLSGMFECIKRYLMAQGVVRPVTAVSFAAVALAPLYNYLLIFKLGLGLDGAALAMVLAHATMLLMLSAYLVWRERQRLGTPEQTWHGWSRDCLKDLGSYYRLAVPSTLMVCLEWWAYEFTIFMSGWLPNPTLNVAAMGVMLQVSGFCYMLPMGLSCAVSVRVSNALGANLPHAARRSAYTATAVTACTQVSLVAAMLLGRYHWAAAFTNLPEVISACAAGFLWQAFTMPGDGLNATIGGMLRGAGRQELGAILNLASYWGLGLPGAYLLGVRAGWGLPGLWAGLILCTSVQSVVMLVVLFRFDWQREAERAAELAAASASGSGGGGGSCGAGDAAQRLPCEDSAGKLYPTSTAAGDVERV